MKKIVLSLMILLVSLSSIFSSQLAINSEDKYLQEILLSDVPVTYGDELFSERIFERTKGERDPIGLVLAGGSAKACAQIGVLRYLEEEGIVPDFIVTSSMSSIVGMLYAAGLSPDQIEELFLAGELSALFSLTVPVEGGMVVPTGFKALIEDVVGSDMKVEDAEIPIMIVSSDLVTKREIRIAEGDFADVLMSSFALPVYFAPYEYRGHLLIDGGLVSHSPIDAAYEYTDTVILSTVFTAVDDIKLGNPISVLKASLDVAKKQNVASDYREHNNFVWIESNAEYYSLAAFDKADEISQIGYESAQALNSELADIYRLGTVSDAVADKRLSSELAIEKAIANMSYFDRLDAIDPAILLGASLSTTGFDDATYYLKNSSIAGPYLNVMHGAFDGSVRLGYGLDFYNLQAPTGSLALDVDAAYYLLKNLRMTADINVDVFSKNAGFMPTLFGRQGIDYIPVSKLGEYELSLHQSLELYKNFAIKDHSSALVLAIGADATVNTEDFTVHGGLGYMLTAKDFNGANPGNFINVEIGADAPFMGSCLFEVGISSRIKLDNHSDNNRVPLFMSDGYTSTTVKSGPETLYVGAKYHNTILSLFAGYDFRNDWELGSILKLEDTRCGIYADGILSDLKFGVSTGFDISSSISIMGIEEMPFSLRLGYEYTPEGRNAFVSSLVLSANY